ncbi:MAG: hypothetical protein M9955_07280 [Rhizobiaceae bacterium]|nr:hypothetical protein [Rhizobiaceae bacterium]
MQGEAVRIAALREETLARLREIPDFDRMLALALAVGADMDDAPLRCRFRACRKTRRCRTVAFARADCVNDFGRRGMIAAEACMRFYMRTLLDRLRED